MSNARLLSDGKAETPVNGELLGGSNGSEVRSRSSSALTPLVSQAAQSEVQLVAPFLATVMILDDDHCGIFNLAEKDVELVESVGTYDVKVVRWSGARGRVSVPFRTLEGTAKEGKDYEVMSGEVIFENNEIEYVLQTLNFFRFKSTKVASAAVRMKES